MFDLSLFHDDDGRKWLLNLLWDYRAQENREFFAGILLQEYDVQLQRLAGSVKNIFKGSCIGLTERPHLYKYHGYYFLMTAEGGPGWNHAVTMARSSCIEGRYELDPVNPVLTSAHNSKLSLQKAGHASLVKTQSSEWYLFHLCGRPVGAERRCILGRETAIQKCHWTDHGWWRLEGDGLEPRTMVPAPDLPEAPVADEPARDDFNTESPGYGCQ